MLRHAPVTPVILAGGSGARLWPLSSPERPKQFVIKAPSGRSLFQETVLRVHHPNLFAPCVVVTNLDYQSIVTHELQTIDAAQAQVIYEPHARNTCPAIILAALYLIASEPDAVMLVLPSDHHIEAPERLFERLPEAMMAASEGYIVTFAIAPTAPETGYGYIEKGALLEGHAAVHGIARFIEKPDAATAQRFITHGGYGWNSGMFLMRAAVVLDEAKAHAPNVLEACTRAYVNATAEGAACYVDAHAFAQCPSIAFDRAVMEHTKRGAVMDVAMGWHDLGSWEALAAHATQQKNHESSGVTQPAAASHAVRHFPDRDDGFA